MTTTGTDAGLQACPTCQGSICPGVSDPANCWDATQPLLDALERAEAGEGRDFATVDEWLSVFPDGRTDDPRQAEIESAINEAIASAGPRPTLAQPDPADWLASLAPRYDAAGSIAPAGPVGRDSDLPDILIG